MVGNGYLLCINPYHKISLLPTNRNMTLPSRGIDPTGRVAHIDDAKER
jgi:hypothetical protein